MSTAGSGSDGRGGGAAMRRVFGDWRIVITAVLGVFSGLLSIDGMEIEILDEPLGPGLLFGVIIGAWLGRIGLATWPKAAIFAVCSTAAWFAAYRFALEFFDWLPSHDHDLNSWQGLVTGIGAGLLGAALLAGAIALLFPFFRRRKLVVTAILVGGVTGTLLALPGEWAPFFLFPVWQGAFALCLALGFPPEERGKAVERATS